jgi:hypothetical protein
MGARDRAEAEARAEEQSRRADQEARARGRLRKLSVLLFAMVLLAGGLAGLAGSQMNKAEQRRVEAEAAKQEAETAKLEAEAAQHTAQARALDLEAANKAREAAERAAEVTRLEAQAAIAEFQGALGQATQARQRAAETMREVDNELAATATLDRKAQHERKSAATTRSKVDPLRKDTDQVTEEAGIRGALQRYQAAYRAFDLAALRAVYPGLPKDREKHLKRWQSACAAYEVTLTDLRMHSRAGGSAMVESQTSHRCVPKPGRPPVNATVLRENLLLRKDASGAWIIDTITAPPQGR